MPNDLEPSPPPEPRFRLARLSGKTTAAWLVLIFLLTGLLIPFTVKLDPWLDAEIVLGIWWLIWMIVLARLLYVGQRIADDHQLGAPRNWLPPPPPPPPPTPPPTTPPPQ